MELHCTTSNGEKKLFQMADAKSSADDLAHLVQGVWFWELSQRGHAEQFSQHVSLQVVRHQLVTLEVCTAKPGLSQQPITAMVRGQEDGVLGMGLLLQLRARKWS